MSRFVDAYVRCSQKERQLKGILFIEPNDEEFKLTMKAARRKVGSSDASSDALQNTAKNSGETHRNIAKRRTRSSWKLLMPTRAQDQG